MPLVRVPHVYFFNHFSFLQQVCVPFSYHEVWMGFLLTQACPLALVFASRIYVSSSQPSHSAFGPGQTPHTSLSFVITSPTTSSHNHTDAQIFQQRNRPHKEKKLVYSHTWTSHPFLFLFITLACALLNPTTSNPRLPALTIGFNSSPNFNALTPGRSLARSIIHPPLARSVSSEGTRSKMLLTILHSLVRSAARPMLAGSGSSSACACGRTSPAGPVSTHAMSRVARWGNCDTIVDIWVC